MKNTTLNIKIINARKLTEPPGEFNKRAYVFNKIHFFTSHEKIIHLSKTVTKNTNNVCLYCSHKLNKTR